MILVDVFVPSMNNNYEFQLDENTKLDVLIEEITEIICQKEHCSLHGDRKKLCLCQYFGESLLDRGTTLAGNGIADGARLILV
ncbi:MAG: hypothetical protein J6J44_05005 [Lachnospiraceae bacterium]|nr:hypothetical protein [Lachnospiraceae bacterium]